MPSRTAYSSILEVAFAWHGFAPPTRLASALPPVVRLTVAMLLRAIVDARLAVYAPATGVSFATTDKSSMEEVEGKPSALVEMSASGDYVAQVLAHYRLCVNELYVWARGEDLDPPAFCTPSWVCGERPTTLTQPRKLRPEMDDKRVCQIIAKRRWSEDERIDVAAMARDLEIQIEGNGQLYQPATVRRWLYEVAPSAVRRKSPRGRHPRSADGSRNQAV